jgi:hypothetical protein
LSWRGIIEYKREGEKTKEWRRIMAETAFWIRERFPVVYEEGEVKAFLVDAASLAQIELILENLLNREEEPEDTILAASAVLQRLVDQARQEPSSPDWERELDEL